MELNFRPSLKECSAKEIAITIFMAKHVQPASLHERDIDILQTAALSELAVSSFRAGDPGVDKAILDVAVFAARMPRFDHETDKNTLIENIALRFHAGIDAGRQLLTAYCGDGTDRSLVGYLSSKCTGEFRVRWLDSAHELAAIGTRPDIIFRNFIHSDLPAFQVNGDPHKVWDLSGTRRFLFSYYEDNRDNPGNIGMLMLAEVDPEMRRLGISQKILRHALTNFHASNIPYVITFARCLKLAEWEPDPSRARQRLQEYMGLKDATGLHPDYGIRFHQKAGAQIICGIPNCAKDPESHNNMCFMIYQLTNIQHPD